MYISLFLGIDLLICHQIPPRTPLTPHLPDTLTRRGRQRVTRPHDQLPIIVIIQQLRPGLLDKLKELLAPSLILEQLRRQIPTLPLKHLRIEIAINLQFRIDRPNQLPDRAALERISIMWIVRAARFNQFRHTPARMLGDDVVIEVVFRGSLFLGRRWVRDLGDFVEVDGADAWEVFGEVVGLYDFLSEVRPSFSGWQRGGLGEGSVSG